jgi:hypothetical protein
MTSLTAVTASFLTHRWTLLAVLTLILLLLAFGVLLTLSAGVDARPMLDPCTYERPVCPTYTPR